MATYAITTAVNIDSLASKTGSDTYSINGGYLTVDQDTRYGTNQNTSAAMGNLTLSATLGGTVEFTSVGVRLIAYTAGSGVVPAYDTAITRGGASGTLLTVYATLASAPTAVGAAMPATGFIKVRGWNLTEYTAGALTGIGATASGASVPGWLEIVGVDVLTQTCNRLGTYKVRGDWFAIGTTDGVRGTTYQVPSNGEIVHLPGVWVETAVASGVYEFYPNAGSAAATSAVFGTEELRGRVCWVSTAGLVRFGHDGTNSTGGFIPETGRRVRIPSIMFVCCTSAAKTVNVQPYATLASRMEFATTGGGVLDIENASFNWYLNLNQPFSVRLVNVSVFDNITLTECASPVAWSHVGIGQSAALANFGMLSSLCFAGGTMDRCVWTRAVMTASGNYVKSWTDLSGFTVTNDRTHSFEDIRGNAGTGTQLLNRVTSTTFTDCTLIGGRVALATCTDVTFTRTTYCDATVNNTITTIPHYVFDLSTNCLRCTFDGIDFGGLYMTQANSGLLSVGAAGCTAIKLRNVGTYAAPVSLGSPRRDKVNWTRVTTTATVTSVAHGLMAGNSFYVVVSSVVAAITVGLKVVVTADTADTFTFVCLNAGATSGTISYFGTMCANVVVFAASSAANNVELKRVYAPHTRTNLYTADNSAKNIRMENVYSDFLNAFTVPVLNGTQRAVTGLPTLAAQTSVYGTHWFGNFIADVNANDACTWTRVTTTCTVTSVDHALRTGLFVNVPVSSSETAVVLGQKTVTVIDSDTFTFACLNAGDASGTLTISPFISRIGVLMNETTADTTAQVSFDAGGAAFTSLGSIYMPTIGDQVTFEHPDYVLGHTRFNIAEPVMGIGTLTNYNVTYALDLNDGGGFGAFKNLSFRCLVAGGSNGSTTVTMTDTTGVAVDDYVFGTNVAPRNRVVSIDSGTAITVEKANTGTVSGILRFNQSPNETGIDASVGFKMRLRIATVTTNATAPTFIYVFTDSTVVSRGYQYPLDLINLTLTPLATGSEARAYYTGTPTEVNGFEVSVGNSGVLSIPPNTALDIVVFGPVTDPATTYTPVRLQNVSFADAQNLDVAQRVDRNFSNP